MVGKGFIYPENFLCSAASEVAVRTYRQATVRRRRNELLISITLSFEKHCGRTIVICIWLYVDGQHSRVASGS